MFEFLGQDFGIVLDKRIEDILANKFSVARSKIKKVMGMPDPNRTTEKMPKIFK